MRRFSRRAGRLKSYTVAVDGLGRRPDFNPETDAIVRVHAIRIRNALKRGEPFGLLVTFKRKSLDAPI